MGDGDAEVLRLGESQVKKKRTKGGFLAVGSCLVSMASARHQKIEAATARLMETEQTREEEEAAQHSGREEMNRYRNIPGRAAPSKATPTTVCQKCLKKDRLPRPSSEELADMQSELTVF